MCGLTGILSSSSNNDIINNLLIMTSKLAHRGPNDEGTWSKGNIGLGHRRLSILDLSTAGSQPMISHCGRYVLVFNGEIYNHLDLRIKLNSENYVKNWHGLSDTETLLAAIKYWGLDEALRCSQGMFALAVWDQKTKCLSLARDRMGEKPLYWGWAGKDLIFGSELKALRGHKDCPNKVCKKALAQYLRFMYVPAPRSIYSGIYKLEPGTILSVNEIPPSIKPSEPIRPDGNYGSLSIRRYWDISNEISNGSTNVIKDEREAVFLTEKVLSKSIKNQMISDVPLGSFLSGGLDSSTIVALMQKQTSRSVKTFTIGFDESNFDESKDAAAVANYLGTDHTSLHVTDADALKVIPDLPWIYDEPFADSSQIPTYLVCKAARKHVTVCLSGDGGDEIFGGYNRYIHGPKLFKSISLLPKFTRGLIGDKIKKIPEKSWNTIGRIYNFFNKGSYGISNFGIKAHRLGEQLQHAESFEEFYLKAVSAWSEPCQLILDEIIEPKSQLDDLLPELILENPVLAMIFQDMRSYLPDDILCKVDRAAMAVSLETRAPFLDKDVINLSTRLPLNMKIRRGQGKWAVRQVLYKYVPSEIIDRPKAGFAVPIGSWLRGPLREWAEGLLSDLNFSDSGLLDSKVIQKKWREHIAGSKDWTNPLWTILMFLAWYDFQK